ncbi:MAG: hypothetical protein HKN07_08600 [Acidimicrobiia bacterium]|nr:hypothetical protein [Acidimicrobiia bacterium]
MSPRRLYLVLRASWWILLIAAILGGAISVIITSRSNEQIRRTFVASAPMEFIKLENESDDAFERRLNSAKADADNVLAAQGVENDSRLQVTADVAAAELIFRASARQAEEAEELATTFREEYLNAEQSMTVVETISDRIDVIVERLEVLNEERASLTPAPVVVEPDPEVEVQRSLFDAVRADLQNRAEDIAVQIEDAEIAETLGELLGTTAPAEGEEPEEPVDVAALQAELDTLLNALRDVEARIAELPAVDPAMEEIPLSTVDSLDELVLEQRIQDLEDEYIALSLSLQEESGQATVTGDVSVQDTTPEFQSRLTSGLTGVLVGIFLAAVAIAGFDLFRKKVWVVDDLEELSGLAEVPLRPRLVPDDRPWYTSVGPNRRRREVQTIRAALEAPMAKGPMTVGLTGLRAKSQNVQELAADLATSLAVAGRSVLLIDTDFDSDTELAEYGPANVTLTEMLASSTGSESGVHFGKTLAALPEVMEGLTALPSGIGVGDAADTVSSEPFRAALAAAKQQADVVLVAAPAIENPTTTVVAQRMDYMIVAAGQGRATVLDVEDAQLDLARRQVNVIGAVILSRYRLRMKAPKETVAAAEKKAGSDDVAEPSTTTKSGT